MTLDPAMTVADAIVDDHRAGREILAMAGNMPQQGDAARLEEMSRFRALWEAHDAMMEEVVYPVLGRVRGDLVQAGLARQRAALDLARDLAARADAPAGLAGDWLAGFERLKELFEDQADFEESRVVSALMADLAPDQVAQVTAGAHDLRARRGA